MHVVPNVRRATPASNSKKFCAFLAPVVELPDAPQIPIEYVKLENVAPALSHHTHPHTSQSPAVNVAVVASNHTFVAPMLVSVVTEPSINSPTEPAAALLFVTVPTMLGVVIVGLVPNTATPVPVSSVSAAARLADEDVPKNVAIPVANDVMPVPPFATGNVPVTPLVRGNPVQLVSVPDDGVPKIGVTSVGEVANTHAPVPVSSVIAAIRFAELGVAKNVATLLPRPDTPLLIGKPVQLVSVPEDGVPSTGVINVGEVENTRFVLAVPVVPAADCR